MGCFIVPGIEAIITTALARAMGRERAERLKLNWLNTMLWGGVFLLLIEHMWHGEVVPWPPFLTAMENPSEVGVMLHEMATVGVAMALTVTAVWGVMVALASRVSLKRAAPQPGGAGV